MNQDHFSNILGMAKPSVYFYIFNIFHLNIYFCSLDYFLSQNALKEDQFSTKTKNCFA